MKGLYYGHSAFSLSDGTATILFDPFISNNPWTNTDPLSITCQFIFISHAHDDHYGDAEAIAKKNDALIISTAEVAGKAAAAGCQAHALHIGGSADFPFGRITLTPALHGAGIAGGLACGCILEYGGKRIYYAGDTGLYSDMKLHSRFGPVDAAFLPIGDNFTMGIRDAALAASWIQPKKVIPIHYNTWPVVKADPEVYKSLVETNYHIPVEIVKPGAEFEL